MTGRLALAVAVLLAVVAPANAGVPSTYAPMVIEGKAQPDRTEFDLTAALQRAKRENKSLYVYLGARDCPFCRRYEAFLDKNAAELAPHFAQKYIVVDLRSALSIQAPQLFFRNGARSLAYADFMREMGDERARRLVYPSVMLLDQHAKPLMQMPAGTGTFETVEEQLEILRLVQ
jgi:thioredoxin-related protein